MHLIAPDHLIGKVDYFRHLQANISSFLNVLKATFERFAEYLDECQEHDLDEFKVLFLYCSKEDVENRYKQRYKEVCHFLDYAYLQYFMRLSKTIHLSARFELFKFLGLELDDIGIIQSAGEIRNYEGLLLPETPSGFPRGHKLISFLADPEMLLRQAYVLRGDSWRDKDCLYQRLLIKNKIENMREFLVGEKRVYVNNIIVSLPFESVITALDGRAIADLSTTRIEPIRIQIPKQFNTIGIIDGQHRVFSYHEGNDEFDGRIGILRKKQHLLVTGIVYPQHMTKIRRQQFEAKLFLEINDKQKRVKGDLKQAIEIIVTPSSSIAIAKSVIEGLADFGPLKGLLERHFYDVGKIKTTSIVSYGLKHIVGIDSEHSFYKVWRGQKKSEIKKQKEVLSKYIEHCTKEISIFISAFKAVLPEELWTTNRKLSRALTTTTINGLIFCIRKLIENKKNRHDFNYYHKALGKMKIDFRPDKFDYKSSHWKALGEKIYKQCFEKS